MTAEKKQQMTGVCIRMNSEMREEAAELKLNISSISRKALSEAIKEARKNEHRK